MTTRQGNVTGPRLLPPRRPSERVATTVIWHYVRAFLIGMALVFLVKAIGEMAAGL